MVGTTAPEKGEGGEHTPGDRGWQGGTRKGRGGFLTSSLSRIVGNWYGCHKGSKWGGRERKREEGERRGVKMGDGIVV